MSSNRFAVAGAALAARKLKYVHISETIIEERFGPERIVRLFSASASKTAKTDCALIILAGSISECRAHRQTWSPEPEARLAKELVGRDFARVNDAAARFVAKRWSEIQALAVGAAE
jgi:hypothetical protein